MIDNYTGDVKLSVQILSPKETRRDKLAVGSCYHVLISLLFSQETAGFDFFKVIK